MPRRIFGNPQGKYFDIDWKNRTTGPMMPDVPEDVQGLLENSAREETDIEAARQDALWPKAVLWAAKQELSASMKLEKEDPKKTEIEACESIEQLTELGEHYGVAMDDHQFTEGNALGKLHLLKLEEAKEDPLWETAKFNYLRDLIIRRLTNGSPYYLALSTPEIMGRIALSESENDIRAICEELKFKDDFLNIPDGIIYKETYIPLKNEV